MEELGKLRERKEQLEAALTYAQAEVSRAKRMMEAGDMTFRMYSEFRGRVDSIRVELANVLSKIMRDE